MCGDLPACGQLLLLLLPRTSSVTLAGSLCGMVLAVLMPGASLANRLFDCSRAQASKCTAAEGRRGALEWDCQQQLCYIGQLYFV